VNVKKGDFVFVNPYQIHSTVSIGDVGAKYHLIMMSLDFFSDSRLLNLRQLFTEKRIGIVNLIENNERIKNIVDALVLEYTDKKELYDIAVKGLVAELFAILVRDYCEHLDSCIPTDKNISKHKVIIPAINKIHSDYAKHITVDELAYECNISKYHFCRLFKEARGMTVLEYLLRYRLRIADILLENTDKSITDIASLCGFEDASYFSRCYKKYNGNTPKTKRAI
jgi:AraC-like DNA-binding protein